MASANAILTHNGPRVSKHPLYHCTCNHCFKHYDYEIQQANERYEDLERRNRELEQKLSSMEDKKKDLEKKKVVIVLKLELDAISNELKMTATAEANASKNQI